MLLKKKKRFSITEGQIKEELLSPDGRLLVRVNIKYPNIDCEKGDPLSIFAKDFYKDLAESLLQNAKNGIYSSSLEVLNSSPEGFLPFAVLMRYEITLENQDFLSIVTDISISDGKENKTAARTTQVWERAFGTKCPISYFLTKQELKELKSSLEPSIKKHFNPSLFALNGEDVVFYADFGGEYEKIIQKPLKKI